MCWGVEGRGEKKIGNGGVSPIPEKRLVPWWRKVSPQELLGLLERSTSAKKTTLGKIFVDR